MKYRPEIDGLRAIAILPVLFYHAGYSWIPGGYLGVDLFFVISGFLITGVILNDLQNETFSIARFYERRARRILPALIFVVLVTLLIAPFFMWPWQIKELNQSAVSTLFFFANINFYGQVDYFRSDSDLYPLLHMWSLSVEEQYYIIFPILAMFVWSIGGRRFALLSLVVIGTAASFLWSYAYGSVNPSGAFYLVEFRVFEIGIGSIIAILFHGRDRIDGEPGVLLSWIGIILITISMIFIAADPSDPLRRIPVLIGAALILSSKIDGRVLHSLLCWYPVRWIGLISFSLYLWHQPVLAFSRLHYGVIPVGITLPLLALSVLLAALSWRFVETPTRRLVMPVDRVLRLSAISILLMVGLSLFVMKHADSFAPESTLDRDLAFSAKERRDYVVGGYNAFETNSFINNNKPKVLLIGDSFSQDFFNMATEENALNNISLVKLYIPAKCQIWFGSRDVPEYSKPEDKDFCESVALRDRPDKLISQADVIILASNWRYWSARNLRQIVNQFGEHSGKVVVIGAKRFGVYNGMRYRDYAGKSAEFRASVKANAGYDFLKIRDIMIENSSGIPFVDIHGLVCGIEERNCPLFTPDGYLISYDAVHLTEAGSKFLGDIVFQSPVLSFFFNKSNAGFQQ